MEEFREFIPNSRSSSSIRLFSSNWFIYASLSIKYLSDKNNVLLKCTSVPKNWVNAYGVVWHKLKCIIISVTAKNFKHFPNANLLSRAKWLQMA